MAEEEQLQLKPQGGKKKLIIIIAAALILLIGGGVRGWMMLSGGPTQTQVSPTTAAGRCPIKTVATPGPIIGPPT